MFSNRKDPIRESWSRFVEEAADLEEKTAASKRGVVLPDTIEQLKRYIRSDTDAKYFMHFSNVHKLGINPKNEYSTPTGIYAYPIVSEIVGLLRVASLPFASTRKYIHVFEVKKSAHILESGSGRELTEEEVQVFVEKLGMLPKEYVNQKGTDYLKLFLSGDPSKRKKVFDLLQSLVKSNSPIRRFWTLLQILSAMPRTNTTLWMRLFKFLGIDGVVDYNTGVIHGSEPTQAVFFSKGVINHVDTIINKSTPNDIQRQRKEYKNVIRYRKGE